MNHGDYKQENSIYSILGMFYRPGFGGYTKGMACAWIPSFENGFLQQVSTKMADFTTEHLQKQWDPKGQQQKLNHKDIFIQVMDCFQVWNISKKFIRFNWEVGLILSAGF